MSVLVNQSTRVLVQGITGKEAEVTEVAACGAQRRR